MLLLVELTYQKMTVGKIYAGLLIAENWKAYKNSQSKMGNVMGMVRINTAYSYLFQTYEPQVK